MAVKFKNQPGTAISEKTFDHLQQVVRDKFNLPPSTIVRVGMSETTIIDNGVRAVLPFGVAQVKKGSPSLMDAFAGLQKLAAVQAGASPAGAVTPSSPSPELSYNDMTDQQWVEHVASALFPGSLPLHKITELYQPTLGTSGGSIYKTCFIGPDLKIAARIKGGGVSFRATTANNTCPSDMVKTTLERLGVKNLYEDRMTGHFPMSGPYDEAYAYEYRALFGAMYAALKPWISSYFPAIGKLGEGVK